MNNPLPQTVSPELPLHVDSTMITCSRECLQKFYNEFVLGLRPAIKGIDLHAGGCFASAIEDVNQGFHCANLPFEEALKDAFRKFMVSWGDIVPLKETPKTRENVWAAVEEYFRKWGPHTDPVQPYRLNGVPTFEFTFAIPLLPISSGIDAGGFPAHPSGNPFIYTGRIDALGEYLTKPVARDEKTTTSIGATWANKWTLRSQFMGYCWALQKSGIPVDTVVVRGIGILKTKLTLVETMKTFSNFMIARWLEQTRRDLWRIRRAWDENYWDFNLGEACSQYGGCMFADLCTSPEPSRWYSNFAVNRWNPLLKNPIAKQESLP